MQYNLRCFTLRASKSQLLYFQQKGSAFVSPPRQTVRRRQPVRSFVRLSVRSSVTKLVNTILWKRINRFWCQLTSTWTTEQGHETIIFCDQEVKGQGQGHSRPYVYLEAWRKHRYPPFLSSSISSCLCLLVGLYVCWQYYPKPELLEMIWIHDFFHFVQILGLFIAW